VKRSVRIPKNALVESADARFENGVLTVQFAKRPAIKDEGPRKLTIRSSEALSSDKGSSDKATVGSSGTGTNENSTEQ
jgi:hypothetical protein